MEAFTIVTGTVISAGTALMAFMTSDTYFGWGCRKKLKCSKEKKDKTKKIFKDLQESREGLEEQKFKEFDQYKLFSKFQLWLEKEETEGGKKLITQEKGFTALVSPSANISPDEAHHCFGPCKLYPEEEVCYEEHKAQGSSRGEMRPSKGILKKSPKATTKDGIHYNSTPMDDSDHAPLKIIINRVPEDEVPVLGHPSESSLSYADNA